MKNKRIALSILQELAPNIEVDDIYDDCHCDRIPELEEENERLRELVESSYHEGWKTGLAWGRSSDADSSDDDWNQHEDWLASESRKEKDENH